MSANPQGHPSAAQRLIGHDLRPRIASGVLLAALALGLAYHGPIAFAVLVMAVSVVVSWEWGRVVRGEGLGLAFSVHAAAVLGAQVLAAIGLAAIGVVLLLIGAAIVMLVQFGDRGRLSALGVLYVGLPAVSLIWIRANDPYGFAAAVYILMVVWATDTFAFFGGRLLGGPKLWPRISPNKTWSGLLCGIAAAALVGAGIGLILSDTSLLRLALGGLILGLVSQAGDLAESALKRGQGVKDASALIPGHGGFLDRIDGLVFAATAAALAAMAISVHAPARAILLWY